jgi:NAD(P)-dependent dehydrogenase (short-subunit alcohol dehydrogenase family)
MTNSTTTSQAGKVWFITGCSSGFGRTLAEEVLKAGGQVGATARRPEQLAELVSAYPETALTLALDVTSDKSVTDAVDEALKRFGRIDVLVNNAGYGLAGAIEEATEDEFMRLFETNVFGLMRVTRAVLPQMRRQRSGHILNLSSIGGLTGGAGWGYYNATKFAVEGFSEALAAEMAPLGVRVTIIEPGPFRTDFLGRSGVEAARRIADYDASAGKAREYFREQAGKQRGDPVRAVHAMMRVVDAEKPPLHLILGALALRRFRGKLDAWREEIAAWESVTLGADFPEGQ